MIHFNSNRLFNKVEHHLATGKPLSICRIGDGEARTLWGFRDVEALEFIMKRLLGEVPSIYEIKQIQAQLVEAYATADYIGLHTSESHLINLDFHWNNCMPMLVEHLGAKIFQRELVDMNFCYEWLTNGYYDKLFKQIKVLTYVSCRDLDAAIRARYPNIVRLERFIIPPEMKFAKDYKGHKFYPGIFNRVRLWMKAAPLQGNLFLFGAGVAGKVFGAWAKEYGAISVDIGSVFDSWAGAKTRGEGRGAGITDETYKL